MSAEYPVYDLRTGKELSPEDSTIVQKAIKENRWWIVVQMTNASPDIQECQWSRLDRHGRPAGDDSDIANSDQFHPSGFQ